jgi:hypothetical protein
MENEKSLTYNDQSDQNRTERNAMNQQLVQLIRERFYPLVRFCGPQHAADVAMRGMIGPVFLGELSVWLWLAEGPHNGLLSDEELSRAVSPQHLVRNLLLSARASMECLLSHLDRIEAASGDTAALLRYYLEDPGATVIDGIALGRILGPRTGEKAQ